MVLVLLVVGFALGADPRRLLVLGIAAAYPAVVLVPTAVAYWANARATDSRPVLFCQGVAAELRAGATLASAVAGAARAVGCEEVRQPALAGDLASAAAVAAREFPAVARELEVIITRAAATGGSAADLFDEIGSLALAEEEIRREVRVAAAPARAAVAVFVVLPTAYLSTRWAAGDLVELFSSPVQRGMAASGVGLFALGVAVTVFLVSRAR